MPKTPDLDTQPEPTANEVIESVAVDAAPVIDIATMLIKSPNGRPDMTEQVYADLLVECNRQMAEADATLTQREADAKGLKLRQTALQTAMIDQWGKPAFEALEAQYNALRSQFDIAPLALVAAQKRYNELMSKQVQIKGHLSALGSVRYQAEQDAKKRIAEAERAALEGEMSQQRHWNRLTPAEREHIVRDQQHRQQMPTSRDVIERAEAKQKRELDDLLEVNTWVKGLIDG